MSASPSPDRGRHGAAPHPDPVAPTEPEAAAPQLPGHAAFVRLEWRFSAEDTEWIAYVSGRGAYGTGHWGLASLEAVHFARADTPDTPALESLIAAGHFAELFETELLALFRRARPIVIPQERQLPVPRRITLEEDQS